MAKQNIFDYETFFNGYRKLRENPWSANELFEKPALFSLLPGLEGKKILDLGCGFGDHCTEYVRRGAASVTGIDISERVLDAARRENADPRITYIRMPMEDIGGLGGPFDLAVSSLAIHYVEDFRSLVKNVHGLLAAGGLFVFSQEHPMNSCFNGGERWTKDGNGVKLFANIARYSVDGERESGWFVDRVKKYHRTFSIIINTLIEEGFAIERIAEPVPTEEQMRLYPSHADLMHRPDFLLVRAKKD